MTSLSQMRDLNTTDPLPGLGPKVEPPKPEPPKPAPVRPGSEIFKKPDGTLETKINHGPLFLRRDTEVSTSRKVKVGDRVRILSGQPRHARINSMIGEVFVVSQVTADSVQIGCFSFFPPGVRNRHGLLHTEFAD